MIAYLKALEKQTGQLYLNLHNYWNMTLEFYAPPVRALQYSKLPAHPAYYLMPWPLPPRSRHASPLSI
jgi:hypothetical protein